MSKDIDNLKRIKCIETDILKAFIDCCKELKLRYFLLGGTLLGAVRHSGFIPWDDDIDVGMFRKDYQVFLSKAQRILPDYYFVQCLQTEENQLNNFAKIRDSRTTFIETSYRNARINHGVYIDVFPLDYYPEGAHEQKLFDRRKKTLSLRIRREFVIPEENQSGRLRETVRDIKGLILTLRYPKVRDALLEREKLYISVPRSNLIANHCGAWGKKEIVPESWYGDGVEGTFEGLSVILPCQYDKWLTQVYGNYMDLPPIEKRVPHHYTDIIDLDKSYTEYIK
ncbi:MAG: LicD family protein [Clostridia bacterium]|nr:LicD family protein [Clostridia bacterium]